MISAGIDSGVRNVKAIIMKDGKVIGKALAPTASMAKSALIQAHEEALKAAGLKKSDLQNILVTGAGTRECDFAHGEISEVDAGARGIRFTVPGARTIIDLGAEDLRAVRINEDGKVTDFAHNEKCAAGTGTFLEAAARTLGIEVGMLADLYDQSTEEISMDARCAVFAESELLALIHGQTPKADIVRAILTIVSEKIVSTMRRVGIENEIAAIGGVALNKGLIKTIERELRIKIVVPADPQFVNAIGAAITAAG